MSFERERERERDKYTYFKRTLFSSVASIMILKCLFDVLMWCLWWCQDCGKIILSNFIFKHATLCVFSAEKWIIGNIMCMYWRVIAWMLRIIVLIWYSFITQLVIWSILTKAFYSFWIHCNLTSLIVNIDSYIDVSSQCWWIAGDIFTFQMSQIYDNLLRR